MAARKSVEVVRDVVEVSVSVPLADIAGDCGYEGAHLEMQLSVRQRRALKRLRLALCARGERIPVGTQGATKHVEKNVDAVRWLLERVGEAGPTA